MSDWPRDASYSQIVSWLECGNYSDDISIWQPLEEFGGEYIAEQIENTRESLEKRFIPREDK